MAATAFVAVPIARGMDKFVAQTVRFCAVLARALVAQHVHQGNIRVETLAKGVKLDSVSKIHLASTAVRERMQRPQTLHSAAIVTLANTLVAAQARAFSARRGVLRPQTLHSASIVQRGNIRGQELRFVLLAPLAGIRTPRRHRGV